MFLYHVTEKYNLKSILKRGLIIDKSRFNLNQDKLFFSDNIKQAIKWIEVLNGGLSLDWIILKVNLPVDKINDKTEITYNKNIPVDKIKIIKGVIKK